MWTGIIDGLSVRMSAPVVVALSGVGETRWGYHQFPTVSRLPDGRLLVTVNDRPDRDDAYGTPGAGYISADGGETWTAAVMPEPLLMVSHSVVSEVYDGEYLCVPVSPSLDITARRLALPPVAGRMDIYGEVLLYRVSECDGSVQVFMSSPQAARWTPATGGWLREVIRWDTCGALARTRKSDYVLPRTFIDNRILRYRGALFYADFKMQYILPDGSLPKKYACWCMVSADNGRSWQRQGLVAHDSAGKLMMGEPCLLPTSDGNLACIMRCADQRQEPMRIAYSGDAGRSWSETSVLGDFGVMPQALLLENGVAVAAFGRPGVRLVFSPDGMARRWTEPLVLVEGSPDAIYDYSCGYTRMLPLSGSSFMIVYTDFRHIDAEGQRRKAVLVRKIEIAKQAAAR